MVGSMQQIAGSPISPSVLQTMADVNTQVGKAAALGNVSGLQTQQYDSYGQQQGGSTGQQTGSNGNQPNMAVVLQQLTTVINTMLQGLTQVLKQLGVNPSTQNGSGANGGAQGGSGSGSAQGSTQNGGAQGGSGSGSAQGSTQNGGAQGGSGSGSANGSCNQGGSSNGDVQGGNNPGSTQGGSGSGGANGSCNQGGSSNGDVQNGYNQNGGAQGGSGSGSANGSGNNPGGANGNYGGQNGADQAQQPTYNQEDAVKLLTADNGKLFNAIDVNHNGVISVGELNSLSDDAKKQLTDKLGDVGAKAFIQDLKDKNRELSVSADVHNDNVDNYLGSNQWHGISLNDFNAIQGKLDDGETLNQIARDNVKGYISGGKGLFTQYIDNKRNDFPVAEGNTIKDLVDKVKTGIGPDDLNKLAQQDHLDQATVQTLLNAMKDNKLVNADGHQNTGDDVNKLTPDNLKAIQQKLNNGVTFPEIISEAMQ